MVDSERSRALTRSLAADAGFYPVSSSNSHGLGFGMTTIRLPLIGSSIRTVISGVAALRPGSVEAVSAGVAANGSASGCDFGCSAGGAGLSNFGGDIGPLLSVKAARLTSSASN